MHAPPSSADAAIEALERGFVAAFRAKDVRQIMSFCATDDKLFVFDLASARQHSGHDAFAESWRRLFAMIVGPLRVDMSELAITSKDSSDLAFSHSIVRVSGQRTDGTTFDHHARVTHGYQKLSGMWLIIHEHVSVPVDMSTGNADFHWKA
jgi:ketosteroid isomerase-like protein